MKYKYTIQKWQKKETGKLSSIIPILFYQGLDYWDPERELEVERRANGIPLIDPVVEDLKALSVRFNLDFKIA
jgi:hypothetical protein